MKPPLPGEAPPPRHRRAAWRGRLALVLLAWLAGPFTAAAAAEAAAAAGPAKPVARMIESAKAAGRVFRDTEVFRPRSKANAEAAVTRAALRDGLLLALDRSELGSWLKERADDVALALPGIEGGRVELELTRSSALPPDLRVVASSSPDEAVAYEPGLHYWGIVKGDPDSLAAISVFGDEVMGLYHTAREGTVVLGRLAGDNPAGDHVLYAERALTAKNPFVCATRDDQPFDFLQETMSKLDADSLDLAGPPAWGAPTADAAPGACVKLFLEADYDLYLDKGTVPAVANYLTGLFNQSAVLYQNEGVPVSVREIFVWDTPSPYTGTESAALLAQFQAYRTEFNGDFAHLLALRGGGGIAAGFSGFCNADRAQSQCFSGIDPTYQNVPTYSWSVQVVTHEMGHLMGSRHTHACVWNGNNTAIDGCWFPEGTCPRPGFPPGGGTIMSYCHLQPVGINFNNGFGPQPGNVIRGGFANASCVAGCPGPVPTAPSRLAAVAQSASLVQLTWADNSANETGFELHRRVAPSGTFVLVATPGANATSYNDAGVQASTAYEYKLRAKNANGVSTFSNVAAATTPQGPPAAPSQAAATPLSPTSVRVTWKDNSGNETSFEVHRRVAPSGTFALVATLGANVTLFNNSGLQPVTTYEYRVRAKNANGNSAFSNTASATTPQITVAAPSGLTATYQQAPNNIRLSWVDNSNNETGFHLQFSYSGSAFSDLSPPTVGANVTTYTTGSNPPVGTYQFRVRAFSGTVYSAWSNVASVLVTGPVPEIRVTRAWDGVEVPDGTSFAFPSTPVASLPISRLFNICNDGGADLLLSNPGSLASGTGFPQIGDPPVSPVPPGTCTSFRVRFHVAAAGSYAGAVTINSNDADENPYNIALSGVATP